MIIVGAICLAPWLAVAVFMLSGLTERTATAVAFAVLATVIWPVVVLWAYSLLEAAEAAKSGQRRGP